MTKKTFTKYPSRYVRASWIRKMSQIEVEDARKILSGMDNDELLRYYTKYAVKCKGTQIEAPDERTGDIFGLAEEELRNRLGLPNW